MVKFGKPPVMHQIHQGVPLPKFTLYAPLDGRGTFLEVNILLVAYYIFALSSYIIVAVHYNYACSLPPLANVNWSAFPECFLPTM